MTGNLAWAPAPGLENVDVFDRFNGVPTLGLFSAGGKRNLFWRALGYVPRRMSIWIYLPLTEADERHLSCSDSSDPLTRLAFHSPAERYATVGIALEYRLVFEREWRIPVDAGADQLIAEMLEFLTEALDIAMQQEFPPAGRELMQTAFEAVRELAAS
jgi:hypothetical protein